MFMYTMCEHFLPDDFARVLEIPTPKHDQLNNVSTVGKVVWTIVFADNYVCYELVFL